MWPLFPDDSPLTFLRDSPKYWSDWRGRYFDTDWYGNTICLDFPEQQVKAYLGELFEQYLITKNYNCCLKVENLNIDLALWPSVSVDNFDLSMKPFFLFELKRWDGQSFEATLEQMKGYIKRCDPFGGCFFYNARELHHLSNSFFCQQVNSIEDFCAVIETITTSTKKIAQPIFDLFFKSCSGSQDDFLCLLQSIESSKLFFNPPRYLIELRNRNLVTMVNPYFDNSNNLIYLDNYKPKQFDVGTFSKLLSVT